MSQTRILKVQLFVEVTCAGNREAAIRLLKMYPPIRKINGGGFSVRTRDEIEVVEEENTKDKTMP